MNRRLNDVNYKDALLKNRNDQQPSFLHDCPVSGFHEERFPESCITMSAPSGLRVEASGIHMIVHMIFILLLYVLSNVTVSRSQEHCIAKYTYRGNWLPPCSFGVWGVRGFLNIKHNQWISPVFAPQLAISDPACYLGV